MDDAKVYGERFYELTFKKAIEADPPIISDYRIVTIAVSDQSVHTSSGGTDSSEPLSQATGSGRRRLAAGIALQRTFKEQRARHAITFHRSIRSAEEFRQPARADRGGGTMPLRPECIHVSSRKIGWRAK